MSPGPWISALQHANSEPAPRHCSGAIPCHVMPCHVVPCCAMSCCAMLCHAVPCFAILHHAMLRHVTPCHIAPCYVMPCHVVPCCAMLAPRAAAPPTSLSLHFFVCAFYVFLLLSFPLSPVCHVSAFQITLLIRSRTAVLRVCLPCFPGEMLTRTR